MKKVIITDEKTLDEINYYLNFIISNIKSFNIYINNNVVDRSVLKNNELYTNNLLNWCEIIQSRLRVE